MWVRFIEVFKWSPPEANKAWSQTIQPSTQNVTRACADAAIAAGKAVKVNRPRKGQEPAE
jgi:hypothetical protein